ncbi:MAG: GDP-mannose 4,6-dehydratase [Lachnospiraceae bacterium]|nr:GDP-mannose 4,6-dehydratase [Lachnospiraceae bacterium]
MQQTHKKALVIGAAGFVGKYLVRHLHDDKGMDVVVTKLPHEVLVPMPAKVCELNILEKESIIDLLFSERPDEIYHLAAQSSVSVAWRNPQLTVDVNVKGAVNLLEALRELFYKPRVIMVGSGEEYGHIKPGDTPIKEDTLLDPGNIYAATKACQNMLGRIYADAYDLELIMVRAFNHIGPGQLPIFVVSDFCKQVVDIELGKKEPVMYVGNLSAKRDFTDVRDVVRAYAALAESGVKGESYNVGSGHAVEIREILDLIISRSSADIKVETDPAKIRPVDVPIIEADISKIKAATDWEPQIPLEQTIDETLADWRRKESEDEETV